MNRAGRLAVALATAALLGYGCGSGSASPTTASPTPSAGASSSPTATASPTVSPSPTPTPVPVAATVTTTTITESGTSATCGKWKITLAEPQVGAWPDEAALRANTAIDARFTSYADDFKAAMAGGGGGAGACTLSANFAVAFNDTHLLSLRLTAAEYLGGASTSTIPGSLTFDTAGNQIGLADLFTDPAAGAARLSTESRTRLAALLGPRGIDSSWIEPGTTASLSNFETAWCVTKGGLELTFPELQVAPHSEGTPRIVVPWAALAGVLDPSGPAGQFIA